MLSSHLLLQLRSVLFLPGCPTRILNTFTFSSCVLHSCLSHALLLHHSSYTCIWRRIQVMKLITMQFSRTSYHFIVFGPDILLSILFSNTFSLCSSLRVQISQSYKTTGRIVNLYILVILKRILLTLLYNTLNY
jgi:hypothetical protein